MITLEVHPEIHATEQTQCPGYATCHECHRSFRPRNEDQLSAELCDSCFDALRHPGERLLSVHVKVLPRRSARG
jgi:hypothetical protein